MPSMKIEKMKTSVNYQTNPRVTETNIYDAAGNRNRSTVSYQTFSLPSTASCSLRSDTYQYAADASTVLKRSHTDYNLSSTYLNLHIVGLPSAQYLCDGAQGATPCNDNSGTSLVSKATIQYDESGSVQYQASPTQHDDSNYGSGFVQGRANVSSTRRYDVLNSGQSTLSSMQYNTAGSVITATDPLNHVSAIGYADSFSDSTNHNTYAYPTTLTDADGYSSYIQYNYDYGAQTRTQGPPPAGQAQGLIQTFTYDAAVRADQVTTVNTGAYTRFWYGADTIASYQSINSAADELFTNRIFDGFGRLVAVATNNPGSSGGYKAQWTQYDAMGRVMKQSNPTEIFWDWTPYGDDAAGRVYTTQTYDWKGRPLFTTNQDGTQKYASYSACGCAGSEVATLTDEMGRQQKIYHDVLGRTAKTEMLNWDATVYATTANTYNARDQVTLVRQYQGAEGSGVYQDTTMTYDGHGRLQSKHVPEQNAGTATVYSYNSDDTIYSVTDARGASATYSYNNRHLVNGITYSAPAGITPTANVTFSYDATGSRTSMTDGLGSRSYDYDQLSRMTSETRYISDLGQSFSLNYQYNLAGELTSITDPFNAQVGYNHDGIGRVSGVTGAGYANVSTYASNLQFRATGATKHLDYGNSLKLDLTYNNRLLNTQFDVTNGGGSRVAGWQYQYGNDGQLSYSHDLRDDRLDRAYIYNQSAQLVQGISGSEASGNNAYPYTGPYKQTYGFDVWGNLTDRSMRIHGYMGYPSTTYYHDNYVNNRNTGGSSQAWEYDADGRITNDRTRQYSFDAAGRQTYNSQNSIYRSFDGDGEIVKKVESGAVTYYLRSTVVGEVITELNQWGQKQRGYVYRENEVLAKQESGQVLWNHDEPSGTSSQWSNASGSASNRIEMDPLGTQVDENGGFAGGGFSANPIGFYGDSSNQGAGCAAGSAGAACTSVTRWHSLAWNFGILRLEGYSQTGSHVVGLQGGGWTFSTPQHYVNYVFTANLGLPALGFGGTSNPPVGPEPPQNTQQPQPPQRQTCDPSFFNDNQSFAISGDANNRSFTGADLNYAARVVFAESSSITSGLGDQINRERDAIASVLYNRIGRTGFPDRTARSTFQGVANAPNAFQTVTGGAAYEAKFNSSAPGQYQNLQEANVNSRGQVYGGGCNDLRGSVDAIRRLINYGSQYGYTSNRGGTRGQGTVIGGSRFW